MEKIVETDIEFHDLLYHAARNNRLVGIISNLRDQLTRFRTLSMSCPGRLEATLEEHREIVEAVANGDGRGASKAAEHHMENSEKTLLERWTSRRAARRKRPRRKKRVRPSRTREFKQGIYVQYAVSGMKNYRDGRTIVCQI